MVTEEYSHSTTCEGHEIKQYIKSKTQRFKPCLREKCMAYISTRISSDPNLERKEGCARL